MQNETHQQIQFLGRLDFLLQRVKKAYDGYSSHGKIFLYARILRDGNEAIRTLLIEQSYLLPAQQLQNALNLLHHIDVWAALWDETYATRVARSDSVFDFPNAVTFPKEEVQDLLAYYEQIKKAG